jgi:phosphoribosylaminoimidazole carboxylase PurE protein
MGGNAVAGKVLVLMGSKTDRDKMQEAVQVLERLGVDCHMTVASAHRTPDRVDDLVRTARDEGFSVIIAGAGMAAHLAGVCAARTALPVIGVPLSGGALTGLDALLSTAQMPPGVPVATVGIDAGVNAGLLAARILAIGDPELLCRLEDDRRAMAKAAMEAAAGADGAVD